MYCVVEVKYIKWSRQTDWDLCLKTRLDPAHVFFWKWGNRELTLKGKLKCYLNPWITHWALALVKGNREPHEAKKKSFDIGGNRSHDLRIRSTVALTTELRDRTEKVGDDLGGESRRLRKATNEIASFCIDHRSRQMAFFRAKAGQRRGKRPAFALFWNKKSLFVII